MDNWQVAAYSGTGNNVTNNTRALDIRVKDAFRCDFCDLPLKTDLDVSKHLVSQLHLRKLDEFLALQDPQDKFVQRVLPKSLDQVYVKLKVRSVRDLNELADKNYFKLPNNNSHICGVAKELSKVLLKNMAIYELKHSRQKLSQEDINAIVDLLLKPRDRGPLFQSPRKDSVCTERQLNSSEAVKSKGPTNSASSTSSAQKVTARISANDQPSASSRSQDSPIKESPRIRPKATTVQDKTSKTVPANATKSRIITAGNGPVDHAQNELRDVKSEIKKTPSQSNKPNSTNSSDQPQPRVDSNYKPLLAKIKVEPKE